MTDAPSGQVVQLPRRFKRWQLLASVGTVLIGVTSLGVWHFSGSDAETDETESQRQVVYPIKHKPAPLQLGIEYHYDRNAIVDSRLLGSQIVGLTASGNLLSFNVGSLSLRVEKVLKRRATCLGPTDKTHVLVGISNGSIVRVSAGDLAIEQVADVPGVPYWIGKRSRDGKLLIAYMAEPRQGSNTIIRDVGLDRTYEVGGRPLLFLDSKDRLWSSSDGKIFYSEAGATARHEIPWKGGWTGIRGFAELSNGHVLAFGGTGRSGEILSSFVARLFPGPNAVLLHASNGKHQVQSAPTTPVSHVLEELDPPRVFVVSRKDVSISDLNLSAWNPIDTLATGHREDDGLAAVGQAHLTGRGVLLTLVRGGFMEVTSESSRRYLQERQYTVTRPSEIVRLADGMAFYGDGGPSYYQGGQWHPLPDPIMPPAELMGAARPGEKDRTWAVLSTIPIDGEVSYIIAKSGPQRHYIGHIHGLRDVFLTARWDGKVLNILGREELPIEPDDTFMTPDKQLWNVDDQGLWNFSGGRWRLAMRSRPEGSGHGKPSVKSAIGEPLHFADTLRSPYYGVSLRATNWALVRLDNNETGGIPLIDEVPVKIGGRRVLVRDVTAWGNKKEELLLATDQGLCVFNVKWATCESIRPEGLSEECTLFKRDGTKRLWLGGRGLWVLRDTKHADAVHPWIPMLADTKVVTIAEATDGRLVLGLENRGIIFLTIPQGWFQKPTDLPSAQMPWETTHPHEPSYLDRSIVLRECKGNPAPTTLLSGLLSDLRGFALSQGPRVRIEFEENFEGRPDIVVRGPEPEPLLNGVLPLIENLAPKAHFSIYKRFGSRGSDAMEVKACFNQAGTQTPTP